MHISWELVITKIYDLLNTTSYDEIIEIVKNKANETPEGEWIIGRGWHPR